MVGLSKLNLYSVGQSYICYKYLELFNIQQHGSLGITLNNKFLIFIPYYEVFPHFLLLIIFQVIFNENV